VNKTWLVDTFCRGQVNLYECISTKGVKSYYITVLGSGEIHVKSLEDGTALCIAFTKHTL
jgi:hypothetical protein